MIFFLHCPHCVRKSKNMKRIGPYSNPDRLAKLDGRRREARQIREAIADLTRHVGGRPSPVQRRLIERAAVLALRLALMDAKSPDGSLSEKDAREYLCWNNSYVRTLRQLGLKGAAPAAPTLADHIASRAA